jgi:8-oxo-dGTP pyrophosphatase MutT (NUDIX family)
VLETIIRKVTTVELAAHDDALRPVQSHHAAIDAHWAHAAAANPNFFNGTILVGADVRYSSEAFQARCHPMQFKDFYYWRHHGKPDWGFYDMFGSAVIRAAGGEILLGVASQKTMNAGSAYFIGGFIDPRDRTVDGRIDIAASIVRELAEETGLTRHDVAQSPGTTVVMHGRMISLAQTFSAQAGAEALRNRILDFSAASAEQELADVLILRTADDAAHPRILPHAAALCRVLLAAD